MIKIIKKIFKEILKNTGVLTTTFLILLSGAVYWDLKERKIPDKIVGGIFATGVLGLLIPGTSGILMKVLGIFAVSVPMLLVVLIRPGAFGGGDIKLMAGSGLFLGAYDIFYSFFYALVSGSIYGIYLVLYKNKSVKEQFAFGPFLTMGIVLRLVFLEISG